MVALAPTLVQPAVAISLALVLLLLLAATEVNGACPVPLAQTDCTGLTVLPLTSAELLAVCQTVPACATAVWGSGAIVSDLGLAVLAQNPVLLNMTSAIALICPPILALVPNASSCVSTDLLIAVQALALAQVLESARLCGNGERARFIPATNTHECYCPPGQRCEPVHPSQMAFDVTMIVFAFIALLVAYVLLTGPPSSTQKTVE